MAASLTKTQSYTASEWEAQTSGQALTPTLTGDDALWVRQTLETTDTSVTPTLSLMEIALVEEAGLSVSVAVGLSLTDSYTRTASYNTQCADTSLYTDTSQSLGQFLVSLIDEFISSDATISAIGLFLAGALSDNIKTSDSSSAIMALLVSCQEVLHTIESDSGSLDFSTTLADSFLLNDTTVGYVGIISAIISDIIQTSDGVTSLLELRANLSDAIQLNDFDEVQRILNGFISDSIDIGESIYVGRLAVLLVKLISAGPTIKINEEKD